MSFLAFLPAIDKILERILPDKGARDAAKLKVMEMHQVGELRELDALVASDKAQAEVNLEEAKSENLFKSGWRPGLAWVCVAGFSYTILRPMITWIAAINGITDIPPPLEMYEMTQLLFGLLGLGAMRSVERVKGVIPMGK